MKLSRSKPHYSTVCYVWREKKKEGRKRQEAARTHSDRPFQSLPPSFQTIYHCQQRQTREVMQRSRPYARISATYASRAHAECQRRLRENNPRIAGHLVLVRFVCVLRQLYGYVHLEHRSPFSEHLIVFSLGAKTKVLIVLFFFLFFFVVRELQLLQLVSAGVALEKNASIFC